MYYYTYRYTVTYTITMMTTVLLTLFLLPSQAISFTQADIPSYRRYMLHCLVTKTIGNSIGS